jgi:hypothetical protein
MLLQANLTWYMSTICAPFSFQFTTFNFSSTLYILPIFHLDCVRWCRIMFPVHFSNKSQCRWSGNFISCVTITKVIDPFTWLMVWQWCHFLLVSNTSAAADCVCQIASNQKLSHEFEKWFKFSSYVYGKSHKMRPACISGSSFIQLLYSDDGLLRPETCGG